MRTLALSLLILLALSACASTFFESSPYIGVSSGKYASVFYRVEGNELIVSYRNNTNFTMTNLVIVVEQQTSSGSNEIQSHKRSLGMGQQHNLTLLIPRKATGNVNVTSYFVMSTPFIMGAGADNETMVTEPGSDRVKFKIEVPIFLIN
jgi:hypothetical protein